MGGACGNDDHVTLGNPAGHTALNAKAAVISTRAARAARDERSGTFEHVVHLRHRLMGSAAGGAGWGLLHHGDPDVLIAVVNNANRRIASCSYRPCDSGFNVARLDVRCHGRRGASLRKCGASLRQQGEEENVGGEGSWAAPVELLEERLTDLLSRPILPVERPDSLANRGDAVAELEEVRLRDRRAVPTDDVVEVQRRHFVECAPEVGPVPAVSVVHDVGDAPRRQQIARDDHTRGGQYDHCIACRVSAVLTELHLLAAQHHLCVFRVHHLGGAGQTGPDHVLARAQRRDHGRAFLLEPRGTSRVVSVIVRENHVPDRLVGNRSDLRHDVVVHSLVPGIEEDDAVTGDVDRDVAAVLANLRARIIGVLHDVYLIRQADQDGRRHWASRRPLRAVGGTSGPQHDGYKNDHQTQAHVTSPSRVPEAVQVRMAVRGACWATAPRRSPPGGPSGERNGRRHM